MPIAGIGSPSMSTGPPTPPSNAVGGLVQFLARNGRADEAREALAAATAPVQRLAARDADRGEALSHSAKLRWIAAQVERSVGAREAALDELDQAIGLNAGARSLAPERADLVRTHGSYEHERAHQLLILGREDEALASAKRSLALNHELADRWPTANNIRWLGGCTLNPAVPSLRDAEAALHHARRALEMDPGAIETIELIASALEATGRRDEAHAMYEDALRRVRDQSPVLARRYEERIAALRDRE